jgi:hypothetical protein
LSKNNCWFFFLRKPEIELPLDVGKGVVPARVLMESRTTYLEEAKKIEVK